MLNLWLTTPLNTPIAAPAKTSDGECLPKYILEKPTDPAHKNAGPVTYHFLYSNARDVAVANANNVWPDGNDGSFVGLLTNISPGYLSDGLCSLIVYFKTSPIIVLRPILIKVS